MSIPYNPGFALQAAKPLELDAWLMDRNERLQRFTDLCISLENTTGGKAVYQQDWDRLSVVGYEPDPSAREIPDGWRKEKGETYLVPIRSTAAGKALLQELSALTVELPPPPGLPVSIRGGLRRNSFHIEQLNGRYWATLGWRPDSLDEVDRERWIDSPLSRYWADRETMDAVTERLTGGQ